MSNDDNDLEHTLEHLICIGSTIQTTIQRRNQYYLQSSRGLRTTSSTTTPDDSENHARSVHRRQPQLSPSSQEEKETTASTRQKLEASDQETTSNDKESESKSVFAEDLRLYGSTGSDKVSGTNSNTPYFDKNPWPPSLPSKSSSSTMAAATATTKTTGIDDAWNEEYGDSINTIQFAEDRLSSSMKASSLPSTSSSNRQTHHGLSLDDVPRALLLKCWENAVHLSSNTMYATIPPRGERMKNNNNINNRKRKRRQNDDNEQQQQQQQQQEKSVEGPSQQLHHQRQKPSASLYYETLDKVAQNSNPKATIAKCKSLGINLKKFQTRNRYNKKLEPLEECPRCHSKGYHDVLFANNSKALSQHYYGSGGGTNDSSAVKVVGCCWSWMIEKQTLLVNKLLQNHVATQTDLLLNLLFDETKKKINKVEEKGDEGRNNGSSSSSLKSNLQTTASRRTRAKTAARNNSKKASDDDYIDDDDDDDDSRATNARTAKRRRLLNWKDVLHMLEHTLQNSSSSLNVRDATTQPSAARGSTSRNGDDDDNESSDDNGDISRHAEELSPAPSASFCPSLHYYHPVLETIQTKITATGIDNNKSKKNVPSQSPPLLLNTMVLESARNSLIERYGQLNVTEQK